jgi:hypothetical protein
MRRRMPIHPARVGFTPTPRMRSSPPSAITASATRNAADEGSPGTSRSSGGSGMRGSSATRHPSSVSAPLTRTPSARSIRSVWSREASGSVTDTGTPPESPASSTALFTCALAVGER